MSDLRAFTAVSVTYSAFTVTDGALRTLILLFLHEQGYSPFALATLFVFYEFFGVVTNLAGGWLGARFGLNATLYCGLSLQVLACGTLAASSASLTVPLVMACQGLSGIAKDLTKMSAKSFVKLVVPEGDRARLFRWVTLVTGSKNTMKGVGFLLGGVLLAGVGFQVACLGMAVGIFAALLVSVLVLPRATGKSGEKIPLRSVLSDDPRINWLAAARFFLFGSRDLWFAVALPVFLAASLGWSFPKVSGFLALWIIGYGVVQAVAPRFVVADAATSMRGGLSLVGWTGALLLPLAAIAVALLQEASPGTALVAGLLVFGALFAVDSALHSFLIVAYAESEKIAMRVGFYYMANAAGRLAGMLGSGWLFQWGGQGVDGLLICLGASASFVTTSLLFCIPLSEAEQRAAAHAPQASPAAAIPSK